MAHSLLIHLRSVKYEASCLSPLIPHLRASTVPLSTTESLGRPRTAMLHSACQTSTPHQELPARQWLKHDSLVSGEQGGRKATAVGGSRPSRQHIARDCVILHTDSTALTLAVAYFSYHVKSLAASVGIGMALALGLVHYRVTHSATDGRGRTPGAAVRGTTHYARLNRYRYGAPQEP
jgi:hypothetical protein